MDRSQSDKYLSYIIPLDEFNSIVSAMTNLQYQDEMKRNLETVFTTTFDAVVRGGWLEQRPFANFTRMLFGINLSYKTETIEQYNDRVDLLEDRFETMLFEHVIDILQVYVSEDYDSFCLKIQEYNYDNVVIVLDTEYEETIATVGRYA